jgi:type VI secretion system protein ImpA
MFDIQSLLQPVTADAPGGPNLEYTSEYAQLELAIQGKPEKRVGDAVVPAEPPDWPVVLAHAVALLERSKDLRVALHLVRALLETRSFAGLADGLSLVRELVENYWDIVHPQPDTEDPDDQTVRLNAMLALVQRDVIQALRSAPLVRSRAFGIVTARELEGGGDKRVGTGLSGSVEAAFQDVDADELTAAATAVERCYKELARLEIAAAERLGADALNFGPLKVILAQSDAALRSGLRARKGSAETGVTSAGGDGAAPPSSRGEVGSREDVVRALDRICAYYVRYEPSSPVPLLLERCKRLVAMSFLDIVKDMLPDGLSTVQTIAGKHNE